MSRDMEDRLRAAFDAKTNRVTGALLRPADPPQDDDVPSDGTVTSIHRRHRWIAPLLAAAAVIAVAAGTTAVVTTAAGDHSHPGNTQSPTPTPTTPSATPSPTVAPSTTPVAGGAPPSGTSTGSTSAAPPVTKKLTVQGVTLDVPTNWDFAALDNRCLTINGLPPDPVVPSRHCQLEISVISASQAASGGFNPDKPYVIGDGNMCGSGGTAAQSVKTVLATNAMVGGQPAEYRSFTGACFKGTWEQWTVPTAPGVIITRSYADPATEQAALYAVTNAQLPGPRSQLRLSDRGIIRSVTSEADGAHIELDRVTRLEQGGNSNTNPATYSYVLPANLQIRAATSDLEPLSVQQLIQLANGTTVDGVSPPLSTLGANLTTDGTTVTGMDLFIL